MFCMSLWALCSATIIITATTKEQMLVSRILNYLYIVSVSTVMLESDHLC